MEIHQRQLIAVKQDHCVALEDGDLCYIPVSNIIVKVGFNPRKDFIQTDMESLSEDIKLRGVIQPIVIRPIPEKQNSFWIIAGERRWRAAIKANLVNIPVIYRDVDESVAISIAKAENSERSDMGVIGEAYAARDILMSCENDIEEAAALLSMAVPTFKKRLMLLNAEEETKRALGRRDIKIGHAELLVGLPRDQQIDTLSAIIAKGMNNVPVADLRKSIQGYVQDLNSACFNKDQCSGCVHNSTKQANLFDDHVGESQCSNHSCYQKLTISAVQTLKEELSQKFGAVYLDIERSPESYTFLEKSGDRGVGSEQYSACKGCDNFGALLSTNPEDAGSVTRGICFELKCHKEMVGAARNEKSTATTSNPVIEDNAGNTKYLKSKTINNPKVSPKPSNATPKAVTEYIDQFLLDQSINELSGNSSQVDNTMANHICLSLCIANMLSNYSITKEVDSELLKATGLNKCKTLPQRVEALTKLDNTMLVQMSNNLGVAYLRSEAKNSIACPDGIRTSHFILTCFSVDLSKRFKLDSSFLRGHTTAGIMSLLEEKCGNTESFKAWSENHVAKSFMKLMKSTKPNIIEKVLNSEFTFNGFLPRCITQRIDRITTSK